jgi:hypothetical protein
MEDLSALASRIVVNAGELRGCLILSKDGLVLGAFPPEAETALKPAWLRFASLGESGKGFVEFGEEIWAHCRRGAYSAFAVAEVSVRPGILLDQLEQALLTAEEARTKRDSLKIPDAASAPSGKPRTSLHGRPTPEERVPEPRVAASAQAAAGAATPPSPTRVPPSAAAQPVAPGRSGPARSDDRPPPGGLASASLPSPSEAGASSSPTAGVGDEAGGGAGQGPDRGEETSPAEDVTDEEEGEGEGEVDRVLLAQEFSRLLQETGRDDEA